MTFSGFVMKGEVDDSWFMLSEVVPDTKEQEDV